MRFVMEIKQLMHMQEMAISLRGAMANSNNSNMANMVNNQDGEARGNSSNILQPQLNSTKSCAIASAIRMLTELSTNSDNRSESLMLKLKKLEDSRPT